MTFDFVPLRDNINANNIFAFLAWGKDVEKITGVSFIHPTRSSLYFSGFKFSNIYYSNIFDFLAHGQVDKTKKCFFLLQYGIPPHN